MSPIPSSIKALKTIADGAPQVQEIPFGTREDIKNLGEQYVVSKTLAVGLNPTDWKHAIGPWKPKDGSYVSGCDSVGEVLAIGSAVKHIKVGDRVSGFVFGASDEQNGSYAEAVKFDSAVSFVVPEGMSSEEAAAFPIPHLTAVQCLYMRLGLSKPSSPSKEGKSVLVWGGSTAVGHHTIQLARLSGYKVFTTASAANHDRLRALGVTDVFDYKDKDVVNKIKSASNGGVSCAIDTACEAGSNDMCVDAIAAEGGDVICILLVSDETKARRSNVNTEFTLGYTVLGYALTFAGAFSFPAMPEDNKRALEWVRDELPTLLKGWKTSEGGSPLFKGQKLRKMDGNLQHINEAFKIMSEGAYKAEKLVYSLA